MRPPVASSDIHSIPPICHMCRRHHGECKRYSTRCFHSGQKGYFIRECPHLIGAETSVASLATPAPEMSSPKSSGRGFPSRGASTAAGRGRGNAPGIQTDAALRPEFMLSLSKMQMQLQMWSLVLFLSLIMMHIHE